MRSEQLDLAPFSRGQLRYPVQQLQHSPVPTCLRVHCLHGACTWERRIPGLRRADAERVVLHQVGTDGRNSRLESVGPGHKGREAQADGLLGGGDQRALIANIEIVHIWWAE